MTTARTLERLCFLALLAAVGTSCFVTRVWLVDYKFDTSALRDASGRGTVLSTSHISKFDLTAEDDHAAFAFRVESGRIHVSIHNRGVEPLSMNFDESREKALAKRQQDVGKGFEIVLPLRIAEDRVSYRFRFTVSELIARRTWWA